MRFDMARFTNKLPVESVYVNLTGGGAHSRLAEASKSKPPSAWGIFG
jgi:hypothetical protein